MICISIGNIDLLPAVIALKPELVEIRYDLIDETPDAVSLMLEGNIKQLVTCRPGKYSDEQRLNLFKRAIDLGATYVDLEIETDSQMLNEIKSYISNNTCDLILSYHNYESTPAEKELISILEGCYRKGADVAKIACQVIDTSDTSKLLSLYSHEGRKILIGMGDLGKISRIAGLYMGAEFTFAALDDSATTAPGQLTFAQFQAIKQIF